jgi:glycosyltransferase involved in cell wall biosynthesis
MEGISLIIPIFNEEKSIYSTIKNIKKYFNQLEINYEIIFVNDGSSDSTKAILDKEIHNFENFILVNHKANMGYGAALKTGIKNSQFDCIAITDADDTYPNDRIPEFYDKFIKDDLDMLVGARIGKNVKIPLIRRPAKWVLRMLASYLANFNIPDLNSGLRIMKKDIIIKFLNILPDGFSFTTTITLAMLTNNYNVHYEKIDYFNRSGASKIRPIYDTLNFTQLIIRTILLFNPLKIFLPISLIMFFVSFSLILYRLFYNEAFGATSIILFVGAVQILAIGMLADLINRRIN